MNHHTYVMASDGDMMEGVAAEAASIAGQFRLGRLIVIYDANQITLSASADVTFNEDVGARFRPMAGMWSISTGWILPRLMLP